MKLKHVRRTFTLQEDLDDFANERIAEESGVLGEKPNLSKYIRDLIRKDREAFEASKRKKAA